MIPVSEPLLTDRELEYVGACIKTGWISSSGRSIEEFEHKWSNFRRGFQRACKRACMHKDTCENEKPKACKTCKLRGIKGLCFPDFRHSAITNMRKAGIHTSVIMAISGHKTMAMFKRYNRIDLNDGRDAMRKLAAFLSEDQAGKKPHEERHETQEEQKKETDHFNITSSPSQGACGFA